MSVITCIIINSTVLLSQIHHYICVHSQLNSTFDIVFGTIDLPERERYRKRDSASRPRICRLHYNRHSTLVLYLFHLVKLHFNRVSRSCSDEPFELLVRWLGQRVSRLRSRRHCHVLTSDARLRK